MTGFEGTAVEGKTALVGFFFWWRARGRSFQRHEGDTHNFRRHSIARSILNSGRLMKPSAFSSCGYRQAEGVGYTAGNSFSDSAASGPSRNISASLTECVVFSFSNSLFHNSFSQWIIHDA